MLQVIAVYAVQSVEFNGSMDIYQPLATATCVD